MVSAVKEGVITRDRVNGTGILYRAVHPKHHGCIRGTFTVSENIPVHLRHGVFASASSSYPAWIRYSNGASRFQSDTKADVRGMAVKLMGVPGEKILE